MMTDRLLTAIENPLVDCIGHPTGRKLPQRTGYDLDLDAVIDAAKAAAIAPSTRMGTYRFTAMLPPRCVRNPSQQNRLGSPE